jgi:hypothetical protein
MTYLQVYRGPRVSDASERLGAGHPSMTEYRTYKLTQMTVKGK